MADQNNAPERIWIKPCDPCETPYDYYVCDPRYLDGRETSYVKSIVSCAGCGGGLRRHSGQFVCRDCGKAETVQEVLPRADPAAPDGQPVTMTYTNWRGETAERAITPKRIWFGSTDWHPEPQWLLTAFDAEKQADRDFALKDFGQAPPPAAPTDNTALVDAAKAAVDAWVNSGDGLGIGVSMTKLIAALASCEATPACQQEAVTDADLAAASAEIERLTKALEEERLKAKADRLVNKALREKAEAERDELAADTSGRMIAAFWKRHCIDAWAGRDHARSMLADAERDMRQRAADEARSCCHEGDYVANAILALPLKHADREVRAALAQGQKEGD